MAALVLVAAAIDLVTHSDLFTTLFVRRMIVVPGQLTTLYYDFFSTHPHALLAQSIFKGFNFVSLRTGPAGSYWRVLFRREQHARKRKHLGRRFRQLRLFWHARCDVAHRLLVVACRQR